MKKKIANIIFLFLVCLFLHRPGSCLDSEDIVRLNKAGIDANTLQVIIEEKITETCALTVQEILDLKKSGMRNETIQMVVKSASFMKDYESIEYGDKIKSIKFTGIRDIIDLKKAGISDEVVEAVISGTKIDDDEDHERAWEMLENMGIVLDRR